MSFTNKFDQIQIEFDKSIKDPTLEKKTLQQSCILQNQISQESVRNQSSDQSITIEGDNADDIKSKQLQQQL